MMKKTLPNLFILLINLLLITTTSATSDRENMTLRIVGGEQSSAYQWHSVVSLKQTYTNRHFCAATLISDRWLLTAAHCMLNSNGQPLSPQYFNATVGEYDLDSYPATEKLKVEEVIVHPHYNSDLQINDIALIKLRNVSQSQYLPLASQATTINAIEEQRNTTIIGWGSTVAYDANEDVDALFPSILREVEVPLMTDQQCQQYLGENYTDEMVCAGFIQGGKDSCQGDSGGPLMINSAEGWLQLGIVSWGYGCASAQKPGAYTRISHYQEWIDTMTADISSHSQLNFNSTPVDQSDTKTLTISNNTEIDGVFEIQFSGSSFFSYDITQCQQIDAKSQCQLTVSYRPQNTLHHQAVLNISADIPDTQPIISEIQGTPLVNINALINNMNWSITSEEWYADVNHSWHHDSNTSYLSAYLENEVINETVLMTRFIGSGALDFDWAINSALQDKHLTLIINDKIITDISGVRPFQSYQIFLPDDVNKVVWIYQKEQVSSGANARLNNVTFTNMALSEFNNLFTKSSDSSSSAGSTNLPIILLIPIIFLRLKIKLSVTQK